MQDDHPDNFMNCTLALLNKAKATSPTALYNFINNCGKEYQVINMLRLYIHDFKECPAPIAILISIALVYLVLYIVHLCQQHLAPLIPILGERLAMGNQLTAVVLVPLAVSVNNAFYILTSHNTDHHVEYLETGSILFSLVLSLSLVLSGAILRSKAHSFKVPKLHLVKEICVSLFVVVYIIVTGVVG